MTKIYNNPMSRLNESRNHYKGLINEAGYPGMCCDGGPDCISVTFSNANDDCSDLLPPMDDCNHHDCQGHIDPTTGPEEYIDTGFHTVDTTDTTMISCDYCDNGGAVSQMYPGPNCPPGTIPSGTGDPCAQSSDPCAFPDISGPCATQADLVNQFVNGNPSQFLSNMLSWYTNPPNPQNFPGNRGCNFLEVVRQKHLGHLATGIAINNNHPNGIQMGPLWIAQKTSKVAYLDCVLAELAVHNCCTGGSGTGSGNTGGTTNNPILQPKLANPNEGGKKGEARKGMRK